jgi:hypothetical protein
MQPAETSHTQRQEGDGCGAIVITALIAPTVLTWLASWVIHSRIVQIIVLTIVVLCILSAAFLLNTRSTRASAVGATFLIWCASVIAFAAIYAGMYITNPLCIRVSRDVLDHSVQDAINVRAAQLTLDLTRRQYVALIHGAADRLSLELATPRRETFLGDGVAQSRQFTLNVAHGASVTIEDVIVLRRLEPSGQLVPHRRAVVTIDSAAGPPWRLEPGMNAPEPDPARRFAKALCNAASASDIASACRTIDHHLGADINHYNSEVANLIGGRTALDISEFILFSASVSSTVGQTDISPNSKAIRLLVVFQAFITVFIFGYAVQAIRKG